MTVTDRTAALDRAFGYPYAAPAHDFVFRAGTVVPLVDDSPLKGRTPVLAIGSNRAPEQLARKFGTGPDAVIPVTWTTVADHDVVYSAHIAGYGSLPATVHRSPGTKVQAAVTWLTGHQVARMHETERVGVAYDFFPLGVDIVLERTGRRIEEPVGCYVSLGGALALDGAPIALAEVPAEGRRFQALGQREKLGVVHARFGAGGSLEQWVIDHLGDLALPRRLALYARMREHTLPYEKT